MKQEKKEVLTQFHKESIVKAAAVLFSKKGINETTMDDIAKMSAYSKSTLYVYFKSKEEIYQTIIYNSMVYFKEQMTRAVSIQGDFIKRYYAICNTLVDFEKEYPLYFDSLLGQIEVGEETIKTQPILHDIYIIGEEILDVIKKFINEGSQIGLLHENIKIPQAIFFFWSSITGIIKMAALKSSYIEKTISDSKEDFLQYSFETLLRVFMKGEK